MGQFDASVFKTWAKDAAPKYTERKLNLRMAVAEFVGEFCLLNCPSSLIQ
jgi:hypothetical protein